MTTLQHQQAATSVPGARMSASRFAGIGFVVLFVAAFVLLVTGPNPYEGGASDAYAAAFADDARQTPVGVAAFILLPLAGAALLWAVAHIASCVDSARGGRSLGGRVAMLGAAVVAAGMTVSGAASSAAEHVSSGTGDAFPPDPGTGYGLDMIASQILSISFWGGSLVLLAIGIAARGTSLVPGWILWAGIVVAPLLPVAFMFGMLPLLVFLLWLAVVCAMMRPALVASE